MNWLWLFIPLIVLIAGGALWLAASRPGFWIELIAVLAKGMLPSFKMLFRPSKLPPKEREKREQKRKWHRGGR